MPYTPNGKTPTTVHQPGNAMRPNTEFPNGFPTIDPNYLDNKVEIAYDETPTPKNKIRLTKAELNLICGGQISTFSAIQFIRQQYDLTLYAAGSVVEEARKTQ
jgi:hypothetical protein